MSMAATVTTAVAVKEAAEHAGAEHAELSAFGLNPAAWVALAMATFIAILLWKGVPRLIGKALDGRIAQIRENLDEARALRGEAEKLRDEYVARVAAAEATSQTMIAQARAEAEELVAAAKTGSEQLVARRSRMAEDRIAAAERSAIAELRATAAKAASDAARTLIASGHGADADKALVDRAIKGLN